MILLLIVIILILLLKNILVKKLSKNITVLHIQLLIKHEKILNDSAIQIFTKIGPLAFLPISSNETSIVYSVHGTLQT